MRIRHGFVSNSSSTSFAIYGTCVTDDSISEHFNLPRARNCTHITDEEAKFCNVCGKKVWRSANLRDLIKTIRPGLKDFDLDYFINEYTFYVGLGPDKIGDNETGKQFKERIEQSIAKLFGKEMECEWILDGSVCS